MSLCEVRIPTYRRPDLLPRAAKSLQAQTNRDWTAVVLDDSPDQEGRLVIESLNDPRFVYRPNARNLGAAGNLDQAFQTRSYTGAAFAFVLEDDNWLLPEFINGNLRSLELHSVNLLQRNAKVIEERDGSVVDTGRTNLGTFHQNRIYRPREIIPYVPFLGGIANSGLFWRTNMRTNLQVGPEVTNSLFQEWLRALQIEDDLVFEPEPLVVFTLFPDRPDPKRTAAGHRAVNRGRQSIWRFLIKRHGSVLVEEMRQIAERTGNWTRFDWVLLDTLYFPRLRLAAGRPHEWPLVAKAVARAFFYPDIFASYYRRALTHTG